MASRRLAVVAILQLIVAGCTFGPDRVVDGWPIGPAVDCAGAGAASCDRLITAATAELERRDPGHPAIQRAALHDEAPARDALGHTILLTRTLSLSVALFALADGSERAVGVADWPTEPVTVPYGP